MKEYDPKKPLISIHVPKCAGGSIRRLLKEWFGDRLYRHYFQQLDGPPPRHALGPGTCVHGHFNRAKDFGVMDYYPEADQLITILRDPLEIVISNYFFWKRTGWANQIQRGTLRPGDEHDYRDVTDFFRKRPRSHIMSFMPFEVSIETYQEMFETHFVHVGVVEDLQTSVDVLALRLGFPSHSVLLTNHSARDEDVPEAVRAEFVEPNALAYAIYHYALKHYGAEGLAPPARENGRVRPC
jgi:hypothetical protein